MKYFQPAGSLAAVFFAAAWLAPAGETDIMFKTSAARQHSETIRNGHGAYTIRMDGTADMDNTQTRYHGGFTVAFQPNLTLTIENTGGAPVKNPRVIINNRECYLLDSGMLRQFISQAALGAGATEYVCEHTVHRTIAHTADNRAIALNLRMLFPLLEAAHEAGLLQSLDYPIGAQ